MFTLIIYISPYQIFVYETMYCCRHVICNISYTCILECVTQPNRCLTLLPVSIDTKQRYKAGAGLTAKARVRHTCVLYHITQALPHS